MLILLFIGLVSPTSIPPLPACDQLRYAYSSRGVPEYDIQGSPVQGNPTVFHKNLGTEKQYSN